MGTLLVNKPGSLTTVQDLGRPGFGAMGISPSGAADPVSLRIGNRLVGNSENAAALEMTLLGGEFQFSEDALIAVTGSDFGATADGAGLALNAAASVRANQSVKFGPTKSGARCYLCVQGGITVPQLSGSRSTHLLSGLGGHEGRALKKGDILPIGDVSRSVRQRKISPKLWSELAPRKMLRVTEGPQWPNFSDSMKQRFLAQKYAITEEANRMGIRLQGDTLDMSLTGEMISEGVSLGAIQMPPSGQPIILFVEQQTTGGYPKIANVIAADLASVGQLRPRDEIRFELVTMEAARKLFLKQETILASSELIEE
ncbi:MAG TPA: biotin-dependent carboxyltransferase family protein [Candidatus Dormibacteraeota bacterium]|jgi:antagonist of KipI|nr:biotin-dependent carboxyltransferase family protein [Candidatus Dormibacteraeota bacterium]